MLKVAVVEEMFALDFTAILRQFLLSNIAAIWEPRVYVFSESSTWWASAQLQSICDANILEPRKAPNVAAKILH